MKISEFYSQLLYCIDPFIPLTVWPPNSPDLNPVDYRIWGVLQERVYKTRIRDVDHLKERLIEEWARFDQKIIDGSIIQWCKCLRECVSAGGGQYKLPVWPTHKLSHRLFSEPTLKIKNIILLIVSQ